MLLNRTLAIILFLGFFTNVYSQKGKNGAGSFTNTTTPARVNEFTALTGNAAAGATIINVTANTLNTNSRFSGVLAPGDLIMIIQMQGASIRTTPYNPWEVYVVDSLYGQVLDYQTCGNYEFAQVKSVISTNQIELDCGLKLAYSSSGKTQVVRVPRYNSLNVAASATLTTDTWNGTIGGILAVEVDGNTTINGIVHATGLGFRGGASTSSGSTNFYPFSSMTSSGNGAEKGEGVGSDALTNTSDALGKYCKGAPGNAGGGGNTNNCGGGGGGNAGNINTYNGCGIPTAGFNAIWDLEWPGRSGVTSSGGGKGGYGTSTTLTVNINTIGPNRSQWGAFERKSAGGFGGRPLDYSTGKIFMGGGGGGGHQTGGQSTNTNACNGNAGGGIIYFLNYGTISGSGSISSNGANGFDAGGTSGVSVRGIDGAGGAGAGGTIILETTGAVSGITANANGGNGGNQVINTPLATTEGQGPGGGGGGGYIASNGSVFTQNVNGGANGTTNARAFDTEFPPNGATSGGAGLSNQLAPTANLYTITASTNPTICTNQSANLTALSNAPGASISWYNNAAGGTAVGTGTAYTTPSYASVGNYTVYAGFCPGLYRVPVIISVTAGPTLTVNSPTVCPGLPVVFTPTTSATSFTWSTGPNTASMSVVPAMTTVYTLTYSAGGCSAVANATANLATVPTVTVNNATICSGTSAILTAGGAVTYTWNTAATSTVITVNPTGNTSYTVIGTGANSCTAQAVASVSVNTTPTVTVNSATICNGNSAVLTATGATTYTWNTTATTNPINVSPTSNTSYTVIGTANTCTAQAVANVSVNATPTISVNSPTICPGQTATVTANTNATTYTWSTGSNGNPITVSPSSTTQYTATVSLNSCTAAAISTVNVGTVPTLTISGNTPICSGATSTLTVNGTATNYTWTNNGQTATTITVSPTTTTDYTVLAALGSCTNSSVANLSVTATPSISVPSATVCTGETATLTASGATTYTWNPGNITGTTFTTSPVTTETYVIIGANGNCLSSPVTTTVNVGTAASIAVPGATICAGQTATLTASSATNYTWSTGANTNSIAVSPTVTTNYSVAGVQGSCPATGTVDVVVVSQPTISVTSASICSGNSATLTASGTGSLTWLPGGASTTSIVVSPTITTTYSISNTNGVCTNSTTAIVDVTQTPTLAVNSETICTGAVTTLTASGAATYTWNTGVNTSTLSVSPTGLTVYTVTGETGGCISNPETSTVTVNSLPNIGANSATICTGSSATLTATGGTSYTWSPGTTTSTVLVVNPASTTIYNLTGSDGFCSNTATTTVVVIPCGGSCTFTLANDVSFCAPINYTINGPAGYNSYLWSPGGATSQNLNVTTAGTYTCTALLYSNDMVNNGNFSLGNTGFTTSYGPGVGGPNSIWNPETYEITTNPQSVHSNFMTFGDHTTGTGNMMAVNGSTIANTVVWSQTITVMPNTNYNFSAWMASMENTNLSNAAKLQFSINGSLVGSVATAPLSGGVWSNFFVNWNSGASTSAAITIVDQNTVGNNDFALDDIFFQEVCSHSDEITINVLQTPTVTANATNSVICSGAQTTLTGGGASTYTWTSGVTDGAVFSPTATATYTVIGTNAISGCTNTAVKTITVNTTPTVVPTSSNICSGQTATLTAIGAATFTWNPGNLIGATQNVNPTSTTVYAVFGTSPEGCLSAIASTTVNVTAVPTVSITSSPTICAGQTTTLTATGTATNYVWSTTQTGQTIMVSPLSNQTYTVTGDNGGCPAIFTTTVTVTPSPTISVNATNTSGCADLLVNFTDVVTPASSSVSYNFGDGGIANTNNPSHNYTATGNYTVTATASNTLLGCSFTYTLPTVINVISTPVADFSIDEGSPVTVGTIVNFTNLSSNGILYGWDFGNGTNAISQNGSTVYADTGSYCVTLLATNATCTNTITKCLEVVTEATLIIPNVFTPNGDGANEVFKVSGSGIKSLNCAIYDRWGIKLYEWDGVNGFWDGNVKTGVAPAGTYFYIINYSDAKGETTTEKGFLNLFRE